jgi:hypothetical protein
MVEMRFQSSSCRNLAMKNWTRGAVAGVLLDVLFAVLGPACVAFYTGCLWAARNDLAAWERQEDRFLPVALTLVCLIPVTAAYLFCRRLFKPRPSGWTKFIVASLAGSFLVPCLWFPLGLVGLFHDIDLRRAKAEADKLTIDRRRLAEECMHLLDNAALYADGDVKRDQMPPLIASLMPGYVAVSPNSVRIEYVGGFDHIGYTFWKDVKERAWVLEWSGEVPTEVLLKIPMTKGGPGKEKGSIRAAGFGTKE